MEIKRNSVALQSPKQYSILLNAIYLFLAIGLIYLITRVCLVYFIGRVFNKVRCVRKRKKKSNYKKLDRLHRVQSMFDFSYRDCLSFQDAAEKQLLKITLSNTYQNMFTLSQGKQLQNQQKKSLKKVSFNLERNISYEDNTSPETLA